MSFQYTYDTDGKPLGVFVPLTEWAKITTILKNRDTSRSKKNEKILSGIRKGLKQVRAIEQGKLRPISLKQLLNEL